MVTQIVGKHFILGTLQTSSIRSRYLRGIMAGLVTKPEMKYWCPIVFRVFRVQLSPKSLGIVGWRRRGGNVEVWRTT
jgi:hypothetical protein